jgi:hypothetical protein
MKMALISTVGVIALLATAAFADTHGSGSSDSQNNTATMSSLDDGDVPAFIAAHPENPDMPYPSTVLTDPLYLGTVFTDSDSASRRGNDSTLPYWTKDQDAIPRRD